MTEEWRRVEGAPGYLVSNTGKIASCKKRIGLEWINTGKIQRILKTGPGSGGYPQGFFSVDGETKHYRVARVVMETFGSSIPEDHIVYHKDGDRSNCHIDNLGLVHKSRVHQIAAQNESYTFSREDVREIREQYAAGLSASILAEMYDTSQTTIVVMCRGESYVSYPGPITRGRAPSVDQICEMIRLRNEGMFYKDIGDRYNMSESGAWRLLNGDRYPDLVRRAEKIVESERR